MITIFFVAGMYLFISSNHVICVLFSVCGVNFLKYLDVKMWWNLSSLKEFYKYWSAMVIKWIWWLTPGRASSSSLSVFSGALHPTVRLNVEQGACIEHVATSPMKMITKMILNIKSPNISKVIPITSPFVFDTSLNLFSNHCLI